MQLQRREGVGLEWPTLRTEGRDNVGTERNGNQNPQMTLLVSPDSVLGSLITFARQCRSLPMFTHFNIIEKVVVTTPVSLTEPHFLSDC